MPLSAFADGDTSPTVKTKLNAIVTQVNSIVSVTDHGLLDAASLLDDDHTQYVLLLGRAGGQTIIGGTASGNDLTFTTTSNVTKGQYIFADATASGTDILIGGDVNLFRSAANVLKTNDSMIIDGSSATVLTIGTGAAGIDYILTFDGETNDGTITYMEDEDRFDFSSPITTTNLTNSGLTITRVPYASTGGLLIDSASMTFNTTNGLILAAGSASALSLSSTAGTAVGGILLGADTTLYRSAADTLKTDDALIVTGNLTNTTLTITRIPYASTGGLLVDSANMTFDGTNGLVLAAGSASALKLSDAGGTAVGGILFGTDATLYRSAADTLKTDDALIITGNATISTLTATRVPYSSTGGLLVDSASMTFDATNGLILAAGSASALSLTSTAGTALGGILFGADSTLYRSAADTLKTDDNLVIAGSSATALTIGAGGAGVDYILTFDGETNNGTLTYMEDENRFDFSSPITTTNITDSGLTDTRIPFASTGGLLVDSADMVFNTTNGLILGDGTGSALQLSDTAGDAASGILFGADVTLYRSAANVLKTDDSLEVVGNIYTATWTDYSGTSTIVGFSSTTTSQIYYKKVGKLVFCSFVLAGTSNATTLTFTLPYNAAAAPGTQGGALFDTRDNGASMTSNGRCYIVAGGNIVTCWPKGDSTAWTASSTKQANGSFVYEAA